MQLPSLASVSPWHPAWSAQGRNITFCPKALHVNCKDTLINVVKSLVAALQQDRGGEIAQAGFLGPTKPFGS